jgi:hypothetical protein
MLMAMVIISGIFVWILVLTALIVLMRFFWHQYKLKNQLVFGILVALLAVLIVVDVIGSVIPAVTYFLGQIGQPSGIKLK